MCDASVLLMMPSSCSSVTNQIKIISTKHCVCFCPSGFASGVLIAFGAGPILIDILHSIDLLPQLCIFPMTRVCHLVVVRKWPYICSCCPQGRGTLHQQSLSDPKVVSKLPQSCPKWYPKVLTQFRIKLLHVEVLTNFRIKLLHIEVLAIFPDKTSTLTLGILKSPAIKTGFKVWKTSSVQPVSVHLCEVVI